MARTKPHRMLSTFAAVALVSTFAGNGVADDPSVSSLRKVMRRWSAHLQRGRPDRQ